MSTGQAYYGSAKKRWSAPPGSVRAARAVRTPDDVAQDVRGLKLRQRVSLALDDDVLRGELEGMISDHADMSASRISIRTYQDFLLPSASGLAGGFAGGVVKPVSDIRGADTLNYSKVERLMRCKVAAVYRLMYLLNWDEGMVGHSMCTAQVSGEGHHLLVGPHGLLFREVSASSLLKVNGEGEVTDGGSTNLGVYKPILALNSAIHAARKDAKCVLFLSTDAVKAVAAMKEGLLPISHDAVAIGEVSYHSFPGLIVSEEVKESLGNELGSSNKLMILHNFGAVCVGETIEETFHTAFFFVKACENQVRALHAGMNNLVKIDVETREQMVQYMKENVDENINKQKQVIAHFEAWMRWLDSKGYKTAYNYRNPDIFKSAKEPTPSKSPTKIPPVRRLVDQDTDGVPVRRAKSLGRANEYKNRAKWLKSPVKSTQFKQQIPEPEMTELDWENRKDLENNNMKKQDKNIPRPETPPDFNEEVPIQLNIVEVQHSAPVDFEKDASDKVGESPGYLETELSEDVAAVTPVKVPDDSADTSQPLDQSAVVPEVSNEAEEGLVRKRPGSKIKKRRSFREKLMHKLGTGQ